MFTFWYLVCLGFGTLHFLVLVPYVFRFWYFVCLGFGTL